MYRSRIIKLVEAEIERARENHPGNLDRYNAMIEEFAEVATAVCNHEPFDRVREELIQLACTAIRFAQEGDQSLYPNPPDEYPIECEKCGALLGSDHREPCGGLDDLLARMAVTKPLEATTRDAFCDGLDWFADFCLRLSRSLK